MTLITVTFTALRVLAAAAYSRLNLMFQTKSWTN